MSRIRAANTKPELVVRQYLHGNGLRYRLHDKKLPGKPDLVLHRYQAVVQVQGCFWHAHEGCPYFVVPQTRREWWLEKLKHNKKRDKDNQLALEAKGWRVLTVWECELKKARLQNTLLNLKNMILCPQ